MSTHEVESKVRELRQIQALIEEAQEDAKLEAMRQEAMVLLVQLTDEELMRVLSPFAEKYDGSFEDSYRTYK